jgi:hypothetical protein
MHSLPVSAGGVRVGMHKTRYSFLFGENECERLEHSHVPRGV